MWNWHRTPVPRSRQLSDAERAYLRQYQYWAQVDGGYKAIQSTRPQTLAYGLNDSPAGLAAWLVEKFRAWSDCHGEVERRFSKDALLTTIMIYWATQTIATSMRDYFENRHDAVTPGPSEFVTVPIAVAVFDHQFVSDGSPGRRVGRAPLPHLEVHTNAQRGTLRSHRRA